jgi:alkanesulfonate monooxygenase SsuD/methylene tetrahydromethanopterin reductase-like flavin-dependent oxidoreductase (luciferase family)
MGALGFQFVSPEAARAWVNRYYTSLTRDLQRLADYPVNANIAMVSAFMCAPTDEEAREKAAGWTFFVFCLSHYGRHGMAEPGRGDMWKLYQEWRHTPKAQETLKAGLIGSPETIRRRLAEFEATNVDQVILLNQTGRTSHQDICESLELFAREVMPEFHAREPEHQRWKDDVLAGRIELEQLDTEGHKLYSHQNEDIVRLTPEELKRKMAAKEAARETGHRA